MIKHIIIVSFILSSCNSANLLDTDTSNAPILLKEAIFGKDILIDEKFIDSFSYSFIKVKMQNRAAIYALSSISKDSVFRWVSEDQSILLTKNGRIIKTYGLENNFDTLEYDLTRKTILVQFSSPKAIFEHKIISSSFFKKNETHIKNWDHKHIEKFRNDSLNWTAKNIIEYSHTSNLPVKTIQYIYPHQKPITIEYYYKF